MRKHDTNPAEQLVISLDIRNGQEVSPREFWRFQKNPEKEAAKERTTTKNVESPGELLYQTTFVIPRQKEALQRVKQRYQEFKEKYPEFLKNQFMGALTELAEMGNNQASGVLANLWSTVERECGIKLNIDEVLPICSKLKKDLYLASLSGDGYQAFRRAERPFLQLAEQKLQPQIYGKQEAALPQLVAKISNIHSTEEQIRLVKEFNKLPGVRACLASPEALEISGNNDINTYVSPPVLYAIAENLKDSLGYGNDKISTITIDDDKSTRHIQKIQAENESNILYVESPSIAAAVAAAGPSSMIPYGLTVNDQSGTNCTVYTVDNREINADPIKVAAAVTAIYGSVSENLPNVKSINIKSGPRIFQITPVNDGYAKLAVVEN